MRGIHWLRAHYQPYEHVPPPGCRLVRTRLGRLSLKEISSLPIRPKFAIRTFHKGTFTTAHREAENSNPQATSNIQTERSASNISIPATFLVSSLPCFSVSPQRARSRQETPINTESVAITVIPLQGIVPLRGRGPRMPRGVGRRR
jgi:hypothetical protein